jgi:hypothetical protein
MHFVILKHADGHRIAVNPRLVKIISLIEDDEPSVAIEFAGEDEAIPLNENFEHAIGLLDAGLSYERTDVESNERPSSVAASGRESDSPRRTLDLRNV